MALGAAEQEETVIAPQAEEIVLLPEVPTRAAEEAEAGILVKVHKAKTAVQVSFSSAGAIRMNKETI